MVQLIFQGREKSTYISSLKGLMNHDEKSNLLYEVPCQGCAFAYIEQTKRVFKSRITEHQPAIKLQRSKKSALCQHLMENHHLIDLSDVKILKVEHDLTWKPHIAAISIKIAGGSWALTRLKDIC